MTVGITAPVVVEVDEAMLARALPEFCRIVCDSVNDGAAISFMAPMSEADAGAFWMGVVRPEIALQNRVLFGAQYGGQFVGTVQLILQMPPNQSDRGEIAKMVVHPAFRRLGIARVLLDHALERAKTTGKTIVTLETRTGDSAEPLYASFGFQAAGTIPNFAWNPDGKAKHATTFMYLEMNRRTGAAPPSGFRSGM